MSFFFLIKFNYLYNQIIKIFNIIKSTNLLSEICGCILLEYIFDRIGNYRSHILPIFIINICRY